MRTTTRASASRSPRRWWDVVPPMTRREPAQRARSAANGPSVWRAVPESAGRGGVVRRGSSASTGSVRIRSSTVVPPITPREPARRGRSVPRRTSVCRGAREVPARAPVHPGCSVAMANVPETNRHRIMDGAPLGAPVRLNADHHGASVGPGSTLDRPRPRLAGAPFGGRPSPSRTPRSPRAS